MDIKVDQTNKYFLFHKIAFNLIYLIRGGVFFRQYRSITKNDLDN